MHEDNNYGDRKDEDDRRPAPNAPGIEFWLDLSSNYSYLSAMRIEPAAARRGLRVSWKPFLLGPIFEALGWPTSPFVLQAAKGAYVWRDMERQCARLALPWRRPSVFPRPALLPMRVAAAHADEPWIGAFCRRMMALNFAEDRDIDDEATVAGVLGELGLPAAELFGAACRGPARTRLREHTGQAQSQGIFGAPSFLARGELFWGNDRLDEALDFAAARQVRQRGRNAQPGSSSPASGGVSGLAASQASKAASSPRARRSRK